MSKMRESLVRAQAEYQAKCKVITIRFNCETDQDLIKWLTEHAKKRNTGTIIKELIRAEICRTSE